MNRELAIKLLHHHVKSEAMIKHSLASEVVMRGLARHLGQDEDKWGLIGLLHDLDVELTKDNPEKHGKITVEILHEQGFDEDILIPISLHNDMAASRPRENTVEWALAAGETITGLITATALVYPSKKLADVKVKSITKRMKEKAFAASVSREHILECERIGLELPEFAQICLQSMQEISDQLGL